MRWLLRTPTCLMVLLCCNAGADSLTLEETEIPDSCNLRISHLFGQQSIDELKLDGRRDVDCGAYGDLACMFCECHKDWAFEENEDKTVTCKFRGEPGVNPMIEKKLEDRENKASEAENVVDKILAVWEIGPDTEEYSLFDPGLFHAQADDENGLTLGFDSDPDPNEIVLLAKIGYGDSFERGSDAASVKAEFEAEAGAEAGIKYSQGVTRRYAEVGAEVAAEFEAVVGTP